MGCLPIFKKKIEQNDNYLEDMNIMLTHQYVMENDESNQKKSDKIDNITDLIISHSLMVQNSTGDPFEIYDTLKVLGEGSFGKVFKVIHRKNGFIRAMKVINKKFAGVNEEKQSKLINEINIMKKLDHPNILKVYEYFNTEKKLYIVTELCTGGELFDRIT